MNRYCRFVIAVVALLLAACGSKELKPDIPDAERKDLQASIRKEGIAIVVDGCVQVKGFYLGDPIAKAESVIAGLTVAKRVRTALIEHAYAVKNISMPFVCGQKSRQSALQIPSKKWKVVEKTGDSINTSLAMPLRLPKFEAKLQDAYEVLFAKLFVHITSDSHYGFAEASAALEKAKGPTFLDNHQIAHRISSRLGSRYLLIGSAWAQSKTRAYVAFSWVTAIFAGAAGATGGLPPVVDLESGFEGDAKFNDLLLGLIDLRENRLLWADTFFADHGDDAHMLRDEEQTRSLWRLLTPLH